MIDYDNQSLVRRIEKNTHYTDTSHTHHYLHIIYAKFNINRILKVIFITDY